MILPLLVFDRIPYLSQDSNCSLLLPSHPKSSNSLVYFAALVFRLVPNESVPGYQTMMFVGGSGYPRSGYPWVRHLPAGPITQIEREKAPPRLYRNFALDSQVFRLQYEYLYELSVSEHAAADRSGFTTRPAASSKRHLSFSAGSWYYVSSPGQIGCSFTAS